MKGKMAALLAMTVLSLAVTGIAYAAWTANLSIIGTVGTGTLSVDLDGSAGTPSSPYTSFVVSDENNGDGDITFTVGNAFPGVSGTATIIMKNTGTVPAIITAATGGSTDSSPFDNDITYTWGGNAPAPGDPIAPGGTQTFTVTWTVQPDAVQGGTYHFTASIGFTTP